MKLRKTIKISWMMLRLGFFLYNLTLQSNDELEQEFAPIVTLPGLGQVRGIVQDATDGGRIHLYQGIRYGRANRFELPTFAEPWTGVYEATAPRDNCPQPLEHLRLPEKGFLITTYSEDCLHLNVWTPPNAQENEEGGPGRAVMVYIFGGAFKTGSPFKLVHDARYMVNDEDVIVVALNYRLGPFGFLYGGEGSGAPANLGMHDIILGLRWVRENVRQFGGDPDRVTLFGNSAGSFAVGALMLSPLAKGLFHRAILQSGAPIGRTARPKEAVLDGTRAFAERLDCHRETLRESIKCLKSKSIEQLLDAGKGIRPDPVALVYGDSVFPIKPDEALRTGQFNVDIDLMYGVMRDEGTFIMLMYNPEFSNDSYTIDLPKAREYIVRAIGPSWGEAAADFYIQRENFGSNPSQLDLRLLISKAYGDYMLTCPVILFAELFHQQAPSQRKIYSWMLTQPAELHTATICNGHPWVGVAHADELFYLFTIPVQTKPEDRRLSRQMIRAWASFAQTGEPGLAMGNDIPWAPALTKTPDSVTRLMALDHTPRMVSGHFRETCNEFWKEKIMVV